MNADNFARAFERNCPRVRLTDEEREELRRLFQECWKFASQNG